MDKDRLIGRVAYSKAGRDLGRPFIVLDVIDKNNVIIVDGDLRKIEKPKKKKLKHLNITNKVIQEIKGLIISKCSISNSKIKKCLKNELENSEAVKEG